ncbi:MULTISPECIES: alpha/beta fold hydrolase [unclassified Agarivorans]|uniref:alpha/beta fold hydrolase n=1 Tax=unclassified Agarivorans TaxID=2636026 RepID=UPI0026E1F160|nr:MULTISPECIES: alpha/beta hydrolase [unclassified Agarivorans]MDO6685043.1 alpha/beta hydrolase [Agarivorans sp. 3_MG-2023]MDO6717399.1 alpha/beta hydrolase [Agarivorans sp. 2_MG-2023]
MTNKNREPRPIVLIRGLVREQRHWGFFKTVLQQTLPERKILSFDIPGNGSLANLRSPLSIAELRQSLRIQLKLSPLEINKVDLVAISLGGMLAVDWADKYPQEIHSITLINSSNAAFSPFYQRLRWQSYLKVWGILFAKTDRQRQQRIMNVTSQFPALHGDVVENWLAWSKEHVVTKTNAFSQLKAAMLFKLAIKPVVSVLVLSSQQDQLVSAECSGQLAKHWACTHKQHTSAGHDLPLDAPDWTAKQIQAWLESLTSD